MSRKPTTLVNAAAFLLVLLVTVAATPLDFAQGSLLDRIANKLFRKPTSTTTSHSKTEEGSTESPHVGQADIISRQQQHVQHHYRENHVVHKFVDGPVPPPSSSGSVVETSAGGMGFGNTGRRGVLATATMPRQRPPEMMKYAAPTGSEAATTTSSASAAAHTNNEHIESLERALAQARQEHQELAASMADNIQTAALQASANGNNQKQATKRAAAGSSRKPLRVQRQRQQQQQRRQKQQRQHAAAQKQHEEPSLQEETSAVASFTR